MNKDIFPWLSKIFVWKKKNFPGKGKSFDYLSNNQNNKVPIFLAKVTLFLLFFQEKKKSTIINHCVNTPANQYDAHIDHWSIWEKKNCWGKWTKNIQAEK